MTLTRSIQNTNTYLATHQKQKQTLTLTQAIHTHTHARTPTHLQGSLLAHAQEPEFESFELSLHRLGQNEVHHQVYVLCMYAHETWRNEMS